MYANVRIHMRLIFFSVNWNWKKQHIHPLLRKKLNIVMLISLCGFPCSLLVPLTTLLTWPDLLWWRTDFVFWELKVHCLGSGPCLLQGHRSCDWSAEIITMTFKRERHIKYFMLKRNKKCWQGSAKFNATRLHPYLKLPDIIP